MKKKNYHHGNLREALIEAAHEILAVDGVAGLSLRKVALAAGVSAPALYSHFQDKRALLAVLATQGFEWLTASMEAESNKAAPGVNRGTAGLPSLALAYVNFSLENSSLFQLMFGREVGNLLDFPALVDAGTRCYGLMADSVGAQVKANGSSDSLAISATAAWSMVHGLSTLMIDGRVDAVTCGVDSNEEMIERVCQTFTFALPGRELA
jgi:AcrR family transcriptional regulator